LAIRRIGIPHLKSCTSATMMVEIMMLTYTCGKFICKIHQESTLVNDSFNSWYWKGHRLDNSFVVTKLGQERQNVETNGWIKKSMERSIASWMGHWRSSKLTSRLMLWKHLRIIRVLTMCSYVVASSPQTTTSTKSFIVRFSPKGPTNCLFIFLTLFALWLYLPPLKLEYVESPNWFPQTFSWIHAQILY
jgi:hypothetical protein